MKKKYDTKTDLKVTEGRLNSIIAGWFTKQYNNNVPENTLGREIIRAMEIMPDEFFDYLKSL